MQGQHTNANADKNAELNMFSWQNNKDCLFAVWVMAMITTISVSVRSNRKDKANMTRQLCEIQNPGFSLFNL